MRHPARDLPQRLNSRHCRLKTLFCCRDSFQLNLQEVLLQGLCFTCIVLFLTDIESDVTPDPGPQNACQSPKPYPYSIFTSGPRPQRACPSTSSVDRILCARNLDRRGLACLPSPCNHRVAPHVTTPSRPNRLGHRRSLRRLRSR